jgi:hypothetical protein
MDEVPVSSLLLRSVRPDRIQSSRARRIARIGKVRTGTFGLIAELVPGDAGAHVLALSVMGSAIDRW